MNFSCDSGPLTAGSDASSGSRAKYSRVEIFKHETRVSPLRIPRSGLKTGEKLVADGLKFMSCLQRSQAAATDVILVPNCILLNNSLLRKH